MSAEAAISFTCNTCGLGFRTAEYQREHMKTDWHRYNLKRRVADLPPISSDVFAEKMVQQRTLQLDQLKKDSNRRQVTKKDLRRQEKQRAREANAPRTKSPSVASRTSSLTSAVSGFSLDDPVQELPSDMDSDTEAFSHPPQITEEEEEVGETGDAVDALLKEKQATMVQIPPNVCFVDGKKFDSVDENVKYLERRYGMVIPDRKYLVDLEGLIEYFNEKVGIGNCCLHCTYMGRSLEAVRSHMLDKQHIKIPYESDQDRDELMDFYDYSDTQDDEGWEDLGEDEDGDTGPVVKEEDLNSEGDVFVNGYELVLGDSGRTAGHRSLQRYFKQRLMPVKEQPKGQKAVRLIDNRSPGIGERQANNMVKSEWRERQRMLRVEARGRKQQNFQKHYRDELLQ